MVTLRAPRIGYGQKAVLVDVDLHLNAGERVAIIGGNGTGKTTLLRSIAGLLDVDGGTVTIAGNDVAGSPKRAVASGVGMVFHNPDDQLFGCTVIEDVLFGPRNQDVVESESRYRAEMALVALGISSLADRAVETLSFGEKKRVCLAGVLAMQPTVLLLDEPTAGLDPSGELGFLTLLEQLHRERHVTQLVATHAIDLVPYFADRVLLLGAQRILADGPPLEVLCREDDLLQARLRAPWIVRLSRDLGFTPLALTLEEAKEQWAARIS